MGVVIVERKNARGTSYHVRWNRRRDDRPRAVHLGTWPEKKYAVIQQDEAMRMLARTGTVSREVLEGQQRKASATIASVAERWLAGRTDVKASTFESKRNSVAKIVERWGSKYPASLTREDVQAWVTEMHEGGMKGSSIQLHLNVLRPLLREGADLDLPWLSGRKHIRVPLDEIKDKDLPDRARREGARGELRPDRQALLDVLEHGGLRIAEACLLTWSQVDAERDQLIKIGTKTVRRRGAPPRNVPRLSFQPDWIPKRPEGANADDLVFPGEDGRGARFRVALTDSCRRAGVKRFTPHDLRHLHATRLNRWSVGASAKHDLGPYEMAKRMGHSQEEFAETYGHEMPPD